MRSSILLCLVPVALCAAASPSPASVTISNAATANMTCSGGLCAPTAADAVLNVQDLEAMLGSGNATVTTTGSGVQAGNIRVSDRLTWSAATTLTLDAYRSIDVNSKVSVAGSGGVSLTTNDGGTGGEFACNDKGRLEFSNLSSALTINGASYTLVNSVALLASAIAANPSGSFALAKDYNAEKDGTYASSPIETVFTGSFNGLGNAISNLWINDTAKSANLGLFAETDSGSTIANIHLFNEAVQGGSDSIGGLVGVAAGAIAHSDNTGMVTSSGLQVGGLLGASNGGVTASGSAATVSGGDFTGGLSGVADGPISDSWATGNTSAGRGVVGGLVGFVYGPNIKHSWASGAVLGTTSRTIALGGLVGLDEEGSIDRSYASGAVTCRGSSIGCGGLVGYIMGLLPVKISQSYATGAVMSRGRFTYAGGLLGASQNCSCEIVNSYATGAVSGSLVGGLVGLNSVEASYYSISSSYASGSINGKTLAGGLIGTAESNAVRRNYWDMTTSGITDPSQGAGSAPNVPGIKGLSDRKLRSGLPRGFSPKIWSEDSSINGGLPYLINNRPPN